MNVIVNDTSWLLRFVCKNNGGCFEIDVSNLVIEVRKYAWKRCCCGKRISPNQTVPDIAHTHLKLGMHTIRS